MLKKFLHTLTGKRSVPAKSDTATTDVAEPASLSREQHGISRKQISKHALTVIYDLQRAGHEAYLVGGGVRDLLLGGQPKDFDVATDATPEQIKSLFQRARIVGRRFRIVHVRFGREIIEVTTFRAQHQDSDASHHGAANEQGMLVRDNVYGSLRDDALRRDFTVNALYYTVKGFRVLDYTGGIDDMRSRTLRIIGDPEQRYREDPVRMLRAIRFASRLDFAMAEDTAAAIAPCAGQLTQVSPARLFDELIKLLMSGHSQRTFQLIEKHHVFSVLLPGTAQVIDHADATLASHYKQLLDAALTSTDQRIAEDKPVTPAFLLAALLWPMVDRIARADMSNGSPRHNALLSAGHAAIEKQMAIAAMPRRHTLAMREIWTLQSRLEKTSGRRAAAIVHNRRFRAAYDFLLLREKAGEDVQGAGQWWTDYQQQHPIDTKLVETDPKPRKRRRRRPKHSATSANRKHGAGSDPTST